MRNKIIAAAAMAGTIGIYTLPSMPAMSHEGLEVPLPIPHAYHREDRRWHEQTRMRELEAQFEAKAGELRAAFLKELDGIHDTEAA